MAQKLAFIGFGVVGQGLAEILQNKRQSLRDDEGFEAKVVAISDFKKGSLYHPEGLDLKAVLDAVQTDGTFVNYPETDGLITGWDSLQTIQQSNADTIVEVSYTDVLTGQPAIDHCRAAFQSGKNVVITNKGPVALAYQELTALADKHNVSWGFEGTVMSGTPALRMPKLALAGNDITEIRGILNGTTNFMLMRMDEGESYESALKEAQQLGYAEADPTSDVEGLDARYKIVILVQHVMGMPLSVEDVECTGISQMTAELIERARAEGKRWKLIATAKKENGVVSAKVAAEKVPLDDPLASVSGALNAITYETDLLGPVTLSGAGAGKTETGFSLLIDLLTIAKARKAVRS